jgi:hypothetical protein
MGHVSGSLDVPCDNTGPSGGVEKTTVRSKENLRIFF